MFELLFQKAPVAMGIARADGEILAANDRMAEAVGYPVEELIGSNIRDFYVHPEQRELLRQLLAESDVVRDFPVDLWQKDGSIYHTIIDVTRIQTDGGSILLTIAKDVASLRATVRDIVASDIESRQALARDVHDGLGQYLTALTLRLRALRKRAEADEVIPVSEIASAEDVAVMAVRAAASLVRGLQPVGPGPDGLRMALDHLKDEVSKMFNVAISLHCPDPVRVDDSLKAVNLYYIAREAVHNAIRHGGATGVHVVLERRNNSICLSVRDNGRASVSPGTGAGLSIMRKRAEMIGGRLTVRQAGNGRGIEVTCVVYERGRNGCRKKSRR